jgi:hypothetical protein
VRQYKVRLGCYGCLVQQSGDAQLTATRSVLHVGNHPISGTASQPTGLPNSFVTTLEQDEDSGRSDHQSSLESTADWLKSMADA